MKKILMIIITAVLIFPFVSFAQVDNINLGKIYFPKNFLHAQKDYNKGSYKIDLVKKDPGYYFIISDLKGEKLFEELAVLKPYQGKSKKFKYRIRKEFLKDYEYYRIKVSTPDNIIMGYFVIKK